MVLFWESREVEVVIGCVVVCFVVICYVVICYVDC